MAVERVDLRALMKVEWMAVTKDKWPVVKMVVSVVDRMVW